VARFFIDRSVIAWSLEGQQWRAHVRGSDVNKGCGKGGVVHDHRQEAPDSGSGIGGSIEGGRGKGAVVQVKPPAMATAVAPEAMVAGSTAVTLVMVWR
jgi:hypothetical protein